VSREPREPSTARNLLLLLGSPFLFAAALAAILGICFAVKATVAPKVNVGELFFVLLFAACFVMWGVFGVLRGNPRRGKMNQAEVDEKLRRRR
jgi:hypothetical protein